MARVSPHFDPNALPTERRIRLRQPVRSLAYVELGEGNGGIVLNISEGGMAIQAVMSLTRDELPLMRIQLAHSNKPIQINGKIAWTSELRKLVGVEFVDLSEESLNLIREWIALESPAQDISETTDANAEEKALTTNAGVPEQVKSVPRSLPDQPDIEPSHILPLEPEATPIAAAPSKRPRAPVVPSAVPPPLAPAATAPSSVAPTVGAWVSTAPVSEVPSARTPEAVAPNAEPRVAAPARAGSALPPDRFGFKPIERQPFVAAPAPRISDRWRLVYWAGGTAVISLVIGWAAGHATLHYPSARATDSSASQSAAQENIPEQALPASANTSAIEVVDLHGERWLIPMRGSSLENGSSDALGDPGGNSSAASSQLGRAQGPVSPPAGAADSREGISPPPPGGSAVSSSGFEPGHLLRRVEPVYPPDALAQRVEGAIRFYALIDREGNIKTLQPLSGPPMLVPAASAAVRQWHYSPTLLDGHPIETQRQITVTFRLANTPQ